VAKLGMFLALSPIDPSCNRGNAKFVVSKNVALWKEVEIVVAVGWAVVCVFRQEGVEEWGGQQAETVFGRTRHLSSATTHWPTLVRAAQSEPRGFP
jgi:hypothetical protein